jgi:hypothetical protein
MSIVRPSRRRTGALVAGLAVALGEPSGQPAWRRIPSYFLIPTADKNIPPAAYLIPDPAGAPARP